MQGDAGGTARGHAWTAGYEEGRSARLGSARRGACWAAGRRQAGGSKQSRAEQSNEVGAASKQRVSLTSSAIPRTSHRSHQQQSRKAAAEQHPRATDEAHARLPRFASMDMQLTQLT